MEDLNNLSVNMALIDEIDRVAIKALQTVKRVMLMNANREGKSRWLSLPPPEHMEHARIHAMNGEIENCLTRCAMALVIEEMLQCQPELLLSAGQPDSKMNMQQPPKNTENSGGL